MEGNNIFGWSSINGIIYSLVSMAMAIRLVIVSYQVYSGKSGSKEKIIGWFVALIVFQIAMFTIPGAMGKEVVKGYDPKTGIIDGKRVGDQPKKVEHWDKNQK